MRTKLLAICLAVVGLGSFAVSEASAREVTVASPAVAALPSTARVNEIVVNVGTHRRYHPYYHHYYRRNVVVIHHRYRYSHGRRIIIR